MDIYRARYTNQSAIYTELQTIRWIYTGPDLPTNLQYTHGVTDDQMDIYRARYTNQSAIYTRNYRRSDGYIQGQSKNKTQLFDYLQFFPKI
jgi:hypothetical protein